MATYLGNASLSSAVKDRVLSTFQQAVTLYKDGRIEEVVQGCGLILRMDPMFDPAKKLLEKAKNPSAPIDVDSLIPAESSSDALRDARAALAAREFQRASDLTAALLRSDFTNEEARALNDSARERMEAAPFVDQFIRKAEAFRQQGNASAARGELEKARALDGDHPAIREMFASLSSPEASTPASSFSSGSSPSFVVDTPPPAAPARGAAQAADFGFTFEEDKAAAPDMSFDAFSFDSPAPAAPAAPPPSSPFGSGGFSFDAPVQGSGGFDFSTAPAAPEGDDQRKVRQYLADGDRAAAAGDYQQAIDLWSRIFLIDVTNDEASQRIEDAKAKRREIETKVDALVSAGELAYGRDNATARAKFNEALLLDPGNLTAHDYLERIANAAPQGAATASDAPPAPAATGRDLFDDDLAGDGSYEVLKPPDAPPPAAKPVKAKAQAAPSKTKRGGPMGIIITIVVVLLVAAGGWYAWSKYMARPAYDPTATQATFHQADALAKRGRFDEAIAKLQDVKPADPQHDKALEMIADLQHKKAQAAEMINGRPAALVYEENIAAGRSAFDAHDYDTAKKAFDTAARIKPLPADVKPIYDAAAQQSARLEGARSLFADQKYQETIATLDPLLQADPQNQSIRRMLVGAHFNLAAAALQEERVPDAIRELDEVLKNDPNDVMAKRSRDLAERYSGQPKDLLYKIYVKYLPLRSVT